MDKERIGSFKCSLPYINLLFSPPVPDSQEPAPRNSRVLEDASYYGMDAFVRVAGLDSSIPRTLHAVFKSRLFPLMYFPRPP